VRFEAGWLPHELIFAARGSGPFTLAYGSKLAKAGALPLAAVLPSDAKDDTATARPARLGEVSVAAASSSALFTDPARFFRGLADDPDVKKWTLWASLVAGVLLLGRMALRLLHDMGKGPGAGRNH